MFRNKQTKIENDHLNYLQTAQKRIKQKKRLYFNFISFTIWSIALICIKLFSDFASEFTFLGVHVFHIFIFFWLIALVYHAVNVFITNKFLGKSWEQKQIEKLMRIQEERKTSLKDSLKIKPQHKNLTMIVAAGEDNSIGKNNDLIWHLSNDLKRFKSLTNGHCIIMGRKTFESFPKPLPNRKHIVITRQKNYKASDGIICVNSFEEAIDAVKNDDQPFVIGGGEIYKKALEFVDKIELTRVHANFPEADTFLPEIDLSNWKEINRVFHDRNETHNYAFSFITYIRP